MQALQWKSSSFIKSISYMAVCKELKVEIGSITYVYHEVPEFVVKGLLEAESKGEFFNLYIKSKYFVTKS